MLIMISGPVSSESERERLERVADLNRTAAEVLRRGHIPVVGVNAARPVVEQIDVEDEYEAIMRICEALAERCDAVLLIGESDGACREVEIFQRSGRPVFRDVGEIAEEIRAAC